MWRKEVGEGDPESRQMRTQPNVACFEDRGDKENVQLLEASKGLGMDSPPELPEGMQLCLHLDLSPMKPFLS